MFSFVFFFSSRRRHTRLTCDWSSDVCSSDLLPVRGARGKQFLDLQNDVCATDVDLAARENYRSVEHLKRYTTTGMGTDQGKTSNVNALVLMGELTGRDPSL